jgi:hypothetical protein
MNLCICAGARSRWLQVSVGEESQSYDTGAGAVVFQDNIQQ